VRGALFFLSFPIDRKEVPEQVWEGYLYSEPDPTPKGNKLTMVPRLSLGASKIIYTINDK